MRRRNAAATIRTTKLEKATKGNLKIRLKAFSSLIEEQARKYVFFSVRAEHRARFVTRRRRKRWTTDRIICMHGRG